MSIGKYVPFKPKIKSFFLNVPLDAITTLSFKNGIKVNPSKMGKGIANLKVVAFSIGSSS